MQRTGDQVRSRFSELASSLFAFDLEAYLSSSGRDLWGVTFDEDAASFRTLFASPTLERIATLPFHQTQAGYCVDLGHYLPGVSADLFLVRSERLADSEEEFDTLLTHELAHLLCDPDVRAPELSTEPVTSPLVQRLKNLNPDDLYHTERFFSIYVAGCARLAKTHGGSTLDTVALGLRHEQWLDVEYLAQAGVSDQTS